MAHSRPPETPNDASYNPNQDPVLQGFKQFWLTPIEDLVESVLIKHDATARQTLWDRVNVLSENVYAHAKASQEFAYLQQWQQSLGNKDKLSPEEYFILGIYHSMLGEAERANDCFLKADLPEAYYALGTNIIFDAVKDPEPFAAYFLKKQLEGQIASFTADLTTEELTALLQKDTSGAQQKISQALTYLNQAASVGIGGACLQLSNLYKNLGDQEKSRSYFQQALKYESAVAMTWEATELRYQHSEQAIAWNKKAAIRGGITALEQLGSEAIQNKDADIGRPATYFRLAHEIREQYHILKGQEHVRLSNLVYTHQDNPEVIFHAALVLCRFKELDRDQKLKGRLNQLAVEQPEAFDRIIEKNDKRDWEQCLKLLTPEVMKQINERRNIVARMQYDLAKKIPPSMANKTSNYLSSQHLLAGTEERDARSIKNIRQSKTGTSETNSDNDVAPKVKKFGIR